MDLAAVVFGENWRLPDVCIEVVDSAAIISSDGYWGIKYVVEKDSFIIATVLRRHRRSNRGGVPSEKRYNSLGSLIARSYYTQDFLHDPIPGVPAHEEYNTDSSLALREHYYIGLLHDPNEKTPARTHCDSSGNVLAVRRFRNNISLDQKVKSSRAKTADKYYNTGCP